MTLSPYSYDHLTNLFIRWATDQPDIRAAIVLGSRARTDRPADQWSDLDLIVVAEDPQRYLSDAEWVKNMGNPWITFLENTASGGFMERRVFYEGGLDVDFALLPAQLFRQMRTLLQVRKRFPFLIRLLPARFRRNFDQRTLEFSDVVRRGVRVILDKEGLTSELTQIAAGTPKPHPPPQDEFLNVVNDFWYHAMWIAKKVQRGELWTAKSCLDGHMKWRLLRVIEWHTHSLHGWDYDTWHDGRFLDQWADPRVIAGLRPAFSHYDAEDVWRALPAMMDLFRWVAEETAERLGYPYPKEGEERVRAWLRDSLAVNR